VERVSRPGQRVALRRCGQILQNREHFPERRERRQRQRPLIRTASQGTYSAIESFDEVNSNVFNTRVGKSRLIWTALIVLRPFGAGKHVSRQKLITRQLGGKRFAQGLAGLCVIAAPIYLCMGSLLTMNAFEPLFWMGCVYILIKIVRTGDGRLWLWFGVLAAT
jgi:hypothetical protein